MSATPESLTPPSTTELTLTPPTAVAAVAPTKAEGMVPIDPATLPALDAKVAEYVESIVTLDVHSPAFATKAGDVRSMGDDDIRAAADTSNRLLASPVRAMQQGPLSEGGKVAATLLDLRRTIEDLDPKQATGVKKLLGMIPFGDKLVDYFRKYESAQSHLDGIIKALYDGQDELRLDNAALEQEKLHLWETMQRLNQYIYIAKQLDAALSERIAQVEATDPEKAKALRDDVLFYVRQKHQDLLTQQAVSIQGYLAIDLVRKNNIELIKGVDRATTTTIAALAHRGDRRAGAREPEARARPDHRAEHHDLEAHRVDLGAARHPERRHQQAGRLGDGRDRVAADRVREHLPVDGRARHVQAAGARLDEPDGHRARDRDRQVAGVPGTGASGRRQGVRPRARRPRPR